MGGWREQVGVERVSRGMERVCRRREREWWTERVGGQVFRESG